MSPYTERECNELCVDDGRYCQDLTAHGKVVAIMHVKRVAFIYDIKTGASRQVPIDGTAVKLKVEA